MKAPPRPRPASIRWDDADEVVAVPTAEPHVGAGSTRPRLDLLTVAGRSLLFIGAVSIAFGLFQFTVADVSERRSQRELRGGLAELLRSGAPLGVDQSGQPQIVPTGRPVALLEIPSIGVTKVVVEGTSGELLKRGPGHVRTSFLPGQPGHAIIVGRRTTYGAPFRKLDALRAGDDVIATTPYGRFTFKVRKLGLLAPGKASRLESSDTALLTLATSDPAYAPSRALVVESELSGEPSSFSDPPRVAGRDGMIAFTGNVGSLGGVALSGTLLFGAIAAAHVLYRRWRRWPTYLLTTPPILALLYAWMEGLLSIMPSTL